MINNSKCESNLSKCIPIMSNVNCKTDLHSLCNLFALGNSEGNINVNYIAHYSLIVNPSINNTQSKPRAPAKPMEKLRLTSAVEGCCPSKGSR